MLDSLHFGRFYPFVQLNYLMAFCMNLLKVKVLQQKEALWVQAVLWNLSVPLLPV